MVGVLGMHSLMLMTSPAVMGDVAMSTSATTGAPTAGTGVSKLAGPAVAATPTARFGAQLEAVLVARGQDMEMGMHECLAVLVAAVALVLALVVGTSSWSSVSARVVLVLSRAGRAPPLHTPSLMELSVLRV